MDVIGILYLTLSCQTEPLLFYSFEILFSRKNLEAGLGTNGLMTYTCTVYIINTVQSFRETTCIVIYVLQH